jgi:hypothetical protein
MNLKWMSNQRAKFMKVNSRITSHIPLFRRKDLLSEILLFLLKAIYAETPERNTKVGAQRCVIHRVINRRVVVVSRLVGLWIIAVLCIKSRTWSRAIITITKPLVTSILSIRFEVLIYRCCLLGAGC